MNRYKVKVRCTMLKSYEIEANDFDHAHSIVKNEAKRYDNICHEVQESIVAIEEQN